MAQLKLKQALMEAKIEGMKIGAKSAGKTLSDDEINEITKKGSSIEIEMELITKALIDFLVEAEFRITEFKAPVVVEDFRIPEQPVNVEPQTLLGDKAPVIDTISKLPGGLALSEPLMGEFEKATQPLLEGGCTAQEIDLSKDDGGLQSTGYVFVGEDPDSQSAFDVTSESGQIRYTKVKLLRGDDWEDLTGLGE